MLWLVTSIIDLSFVLITDGELKVCLRLSVITQEAYNAMLSIDEYFSQYFNSLQ